MDMLLMHKDDPVIQINVDEGVYDVLNKDMVPYQLRGKLVDVPDLGEAKTRYERTQAIVAMNRDYNAVMSYMASRVLPLTRENAKKLYSLFGFEQLQDDISKAKVAMVCRAVSLQDDYWFKTEADPARWADVSLRHNHLSEIVAQVSLCGSSLTIQGEVCTPEMNGQGAYAKAWAREDGGLYLHKAGSRGGDEESRLEVMVSRLLDKCNVDHVRYEDSQLYGRYTCRCRCMTDDRLSILPGMDLVSYCNVNGLDPRLEIYKLGGDEMYKMWIVDYLISNRDRHGLNWGFFYDSDDMRILRPHPLFDHNNAFDRELMRDKGALYLFDRSMTMQEAAHKAMDRVDFHFTEEIRRDDFMDREQYDSFMDRAEELEIPLERGKEEDLLSDRLEAAERDSLRISSSRKEDIGLDMSL